MQNHTIRFLAAEFDMGNQLGVGVEVLDASGNRVGRHAVRFHRDSPAPHIHDKLNELAEFIERKTSRQEESDGTR